LLIGHGFDQCLVGLHPSSRCEWARANLP
jgi:hypothetical protein